MLLRITFILILASAIVGGTYFAIHSLYIEPEMKLKADKAAAPPAPPGDPSLPDFRECLELRRTSSPAAAVAAFERFLEAYPASTKRTEARDALGELNSAMFFNVKATDENSIVVKPGDSIARIANRTKMPLELLVHLNKLKSDRIHPGQRLIAFPINFRLVLKQRDERVILMRDDKFFRQYPTLSWPGKKPLTPLPKQTVRVTDKSALNDADQPPKPLSDEFFGCFHTIGLPIAGHSVFSHPDETTRPLPNGIRLAREAMSEIAVLLPKGAQVTLE